MAGSKIRLVNFVATAALLAVVFTSGPARTARGQQAAAKPVDFAHEIVPVLRKHCAECHAGGQRKGGLSINSRASFLKGGDSGPAAVAGKAAASEFLARVRATDAETRMPPEGPRLTAVEIAVLDRWVEAGLPWEEGFTFGNRGYEPPLAPRRPALPDAVDGRDHPIDRILDADLAKRGGERPAGVDDATFARRVHLDLTGLLPAPETLADFLANRSPDRRKQLIATLLADDVAYAEHWLTFWNDLLRNDYTGTGFITGGRKQISAWLYRSLVENKPYDQFARELIAPSPDSEGFSAGIRWRGDVSAGQTVEIQFAQSVGQSFLGINLKCASCHDSFVDRWTLADSYGLAAIYSQQPLELHRCDKPLGRKATAAWLFPELGKIDSALPQPDRLRQLAALMTHPGNGRFSRTIVNRLWHRLMGRGIVHPTDAMQTPPFNADLLDYLAAHLADNAYDLKKTLALICESQAYQSRVERLAANADEQGYSYGGPRAKRLTAEQFVDAVWQLTGAAPQRIDAPVVRGKRLASPASPPADRTVAGTAAGTVSGTAAGNVAGKSVAAATNAAEWIWSTDGTGSPPPPSDQTITLRHRFSLPAAPTHAVAALTVDNSYVLYVNGRRVAADDTWETVEVVSLAGFVKAGDNEILLVAKNGGAGPNPAAACFEARITAPGQPTTLVRSSSAWEWSSKSPGGNGKFAAEPTDWAKAVAASNPGTWQTRVADEFAAAAALGAASRLPMVRASLMKNDFLMRALGRPHREQIVSVRPAELTTLEAIDLNNGQILANYLQQGGRNLAGRRWESPDALIDWLFRFALSRPPTADESAAAREALGAQITPQGVEDLLWCVAMLPEFQLVR
jgi:mono/diheme cytochrome c family protein